MNDTITSELPASGFDIGTPLIAYKPEPRKYSLNDIFTISKNPEEEAPPPPPSRHGFKPLLNANYDYQHYLELKKHRRASLYSDYEGDEIASEDSEMEEELEEH